MNQPSIEDTEASRLTANLGLWDAVSIIVGIVVGTSIFKTSPMVFDNVDGIWQGMGCWLAAGVLALVGSLCYAELATTYPRVGGDYVYLTRAYGRPVGFLFGWAQLAVILTGSIGAMAYAFADYSLKLWGLDARWGVWFAVGSVVALTILNLLGVVFGKVVQNLLTIVKVVGLAGIVVAGFVADGSGKNVSGYSLSVVGVIEAGWGGGGAPAAVVAIPAADGLASMAARGLGAYGLAMVLILYAYGGWNDAAFVAAEVRDRRRNMPRALLYGTAGITVIYLLVNAAYLWGLGLDGLRKSSVPAADLLDLAFGSGGSKTISLLVMLSALGAINGLIFAGARVYAGLGADHRLFAWLSRWSARGSAPVWSLIAQSAVALLLIVAVGTQGGRDTIDAALQAIGLGALPWARYFGGFETLVAGTAPVFWVFFLMTGLSVFVLRWKDRDLPRPFSAPFFPVEPILFCGMCVYMLYSSLTWAKTLSLLGFVPLALGVPLYWLSQAQGAAAPSARQP